MLARAVAFVACFWLIVGLLWLGADFAAWR